MPRRIPHATEREYWSNRDQGLHHDWEAPERDEQAELHDPIDYSAIGGPESERSYGRTRSDTGDYPFGRFQGSADRDPYGPLDRGGYVKLHGPDYGRGADGRRSHRGRGPLDYRRADERVYADVCEALTDDAQVDATNIEVTVTEGEVTLSGHVASRDEKRRAEDVADRIAGVRDIHNRLKVQSAIPRVEGKDV
jgi:hypothetical protein